LAQGLKDWKMALETPVAPPQSAAPAPRVRGRVRTAVVLGLAVALVYGVSNPSVVGFALSTRDAALLPSPQLPAPSLPARANTASQQGSPEGAAPSAAFGKFARLAPYLSFLGFAPAEAFTATHGGNPTSRMPRSPAAPAVAPRAPAPQMMPIGVPKVPYKLPGNMQADWIDLYNRLYRERILFLGQQIDDELANQIIAIMLYLDSESKDPIRMYINTPGGSVASGFAMFDTMQFTKSPVETTNVGTAASMGSLLLAGGERGRRAAMPNARTMIHQPAAGGIQGQASDIKVEAERIMQIRDQVANYYSTLTGQPQSKILVDLDRDLWMSADQAKDYGLVDQVIRPRERDPSLFEEDPRYS